jgi:pimeloyl-ACP methyl ester carboxylesterase
MKYVRVNIAIFLVGLLFSTCKKEFTGLSANASEVFWVTNNGADMPVQVKGNTLSKVMILIVHGGPGDGSEDYTGNETARLRDKYGVAYWDQRNAGNAAGNNNFSKLSLSQLINDLDAVVKVLKVRYDGADVFLYAHSFGGLLAAGYLVADSNQSQIRGWIEIDGAHNYPLCNTSSQVMLMDTAASEISKGHNVSQWQEILDYCSTHNPLASYDVSSQIETYAGLAEGYMGINQNNSMLNLANDPFNQLVNYYNLYYTSAGDNFLQSLESASYSDQLYKIKIPSLLLWGQYDFIVPPVVGEDGIENLGSSNKKLVFFPHSGHRPMDTETDSVENEIIRFVDGVK